jgi:hypothetical protein
MSAPTVEHNVFLSWSGPTSRQHANAFREWIMESMELAKPWMSEHDIEAGRLWLPQLTDQLRAHKVGAVFLTPDNMWSAWPLFEAGALCNNIGDTGRLFVIRIGIEQSLPLNHPLFQLQQVKCDQEGMRTVYVKLAQTLQQVIDKKQVDAAFREFWPRLKDRLDKIPPPTETPPVQEPTTAVIPEEVLSILRNQSANYEAMAVAMGKLMDGLKTLSAENIQLRQQLKAADSNVPAYFSPNATAMSGSFLDDLVIGGSMIEEPLRRALRGQLEEVERSRNTEATSKAAATPAKKLK